EAPAAELTVPAATLLVHTPFRRPAIVSGGERTHLPAGQRTSGDETEGRDTVDPQSSLSSQVRCSRCRREPRNDADYVTWHALDEGAVCPGCLTMLEAEAHRAGD